MPDYRLTDDLCTATEALRRATCALAQAAAAARMTGDEHRALDAATRALDSALDCVGVVYTMATAAPGSLQAASEAASALMSLGMPPKAAHEAALAASGHDGSVVGIISAALRR